MKKIVLALIMVVATFVVGCDGSSSDSNESKSPAELAVAGRALQDLSALDVAQLGMPAPAPMTSRGSAFTSADSISSPVAPPPQNLPANDPRWLWVVHPLRLRGNDDIMPRIVEPLIAARYVLFERPACATVTETGTCPPNPGVLNSTCTSNIVFDANGCTVSASVGANETALFLTGTIDVVAKITQTGAHPQIKMNTEVTATNFTVAEPGGAWIMYGGTLIEDFDGASAPPAFTLVHTVQQADPIVIASSAAITFSLYGVRTTVVVPNASVNVNSTGTLTVYRPEMNPITLNTTLTRSATMGPTSLTLAITRTFTNPATSQTWKREANITLTPSNDPVTEVVINGTQTYTEWSGVEIVVSIDNVAMDLNCGAPRGGSMVVAAPDVVVTIAFDNNCNCTAFWSDSNGESGTFNFCGEHISN